MWWLLILQSAIYVAGSRLVAARRYSWGWNKAYARKIFAFGWPLLINGLLLYIILQRDRFVIRAAHRLFKNIPYTLVDLAEYSVPLPLTPAPPISSLNVRPPSSLPPLSPA